MDSEQDVMMFMAKSLRALLLKKNYMKCTVGGDKVQRLYMHV